MPRKLSEKDVEAIKDDLRWHAKHGKKGHMRGFVWDIFTIGIVLFILFIALPIITNLGNNTTQQVVNNCVNCNSTNIASLNAEANGMFNNTFDVVMVVIYFLLVLCTFISAGYEGANPAATLLLGLFFIIIAEVVTFGISDVAHSYITSAQNLNAAQHFGLSTYLMEYLPIFNGFLTIGYIVFVISKREVFEGSGGAPFGSGGTVSQ